MGAPNYSLFSEDDTLARHSTPEYAVLSFHALSLVRGLGRVSLGALCDAFSPLGIVWSEPFERIRDVLQHAKNKDAEAVATRVVQDRDVLLERGGHRTAQLTHAGIRLIFRSDPEYPQRLAAANGPRWLFVFGNIDVLHRQSAVAVVGTRTPTDKGRAAARKVSRVLTDAGFVVISGLAEGIDTAVHEAVLDGGGETVAVLGNGLGIEFPAGSNALRQRIVDGGGAIVTEYLLSDTYSRRSFIERNRIQAALAGVVIPVQGARQSGTARTIGYARELSRPLAGVWVGKPISSSENEILDVLASLAAPVFDLSNPASVRGLLGYLAPFASDARPLRDESDPPLILSKAVAPETRRAYTAALRTLRNVIAHRQPDAAEAEWLLNAVRTLLTPR